MSRRSAVRDRFRTEVEGIGTRGIDIRD